MGWTVGTSQNPDVPTSQRPNVPTFYRLDHPEFGEMTTMAPHTPATTRPRENRRLTNSRLSADSVRDRGILRTLRLKSATEISGCDRGQDSASAAVTAAEPEPASMTPSSTSSPRQSLFHIGWSSRHVIARTSSKSCKALAGFPRCTAPETTRSLR